MWREDPLKLSNLAEMQPIKTQLRKQSYVKDLLGQGPQSLEKCAVE